jgi:hypothetical protein
MPELLQNPILRVLEPVISMIDSCHPDDGLAAFSSEAITPFPVGKTHATTDIDVEENFDAKLLVIAYWFDPLKAKYFPPVLE